MIVYAIILFAAAVLFLALGIALYQGNTNLIHDYHQAAIQESERLAYGRAFAKGMFALCATLLVSGMIALVGKTLAASLAVLFVGLIVSVIVLAKVQKKYNGGMF